jgi:hypothetical protein
MTSQAQPNTSSGTDLTAVTNSSSDIVASRWHDEIRFSAI